MLEPLFGEHFYFYTFIFKETFQCINWALIQHFCKATIRFGGDLIIFKISELKTRYFDFLGFIFEVAL